jgi:hypothetical protein
MLISIMHYTLCNLVSKHVLTLPCISHATSQYMWVYTQALGYYQLYSV